MSNGKLLDSVVLSDAGLMEAQAKMSTKASKQFLAFISPDMMVQTVIATSISAAVYVGHSYVQFPITEGVARMVHIVTGLLLGILLTARVILGVYMTFTATRQVYAFTNACRSIAVLSTAVNETLTVSAGAELEKKAVSKFRYELVRLLNLSFYCYTLMLQGMRLAVPPSTLRTVSGNAEDELLATCPNPTVMVARLISALFEQQRAAKRITSEQVGVLMGKTGELIEAYHSSLSMLLSPSPISLTAFVYFFTAAWVYFSAAALAVIELGDSKAFHGFGLWMTVCYSGFLSLFMFGLYEAGNVVEAPLKALMSLLASDAMAQTLSEDLSCLVDDETVPIMFPKE